MKLQEFIDEISKLVSGRLGSSYIVASRKVIKNNSVEYDCLVISNNESGISPSIYLNRYYLEWMNGRPLEDIADDILKFYREGLRQLDLRKCTYIDTENSKEKVVLRLVNYEKNVKLLSECPHTRINDLAVTYHYLISNNDEDGVSSARIDYNNMEFFNLTEEDIRKNALANTERLFPPEFEKMNNLLKRYIEHRGMGVMEKCIYDDILPMYVLTTANKVNGAACILYSGMLERIRKALGKNYYIIPSSINEVMILPDASNIKREELEQMVQAVNREAVLETEVLSDRVYYYPDDNFVLPDTL